VLELETKNLGRIRSGRVKLAPLTLLVGKNNTGKSYLATLMWSLSSLTQLFSKVSDLEGRPQWFQDFIRTKPSERVSKIDITPEQMEEVVADVNETFRVAGSAFLSRMFAFDGFGSTEVRLKPAKPLQITIEIQFPTAGLERGMQNVSFKSETFEYAFSYPQRLLGDNAGMRVYNELIKIAIFGELTPKYRTALYIPAARTGLMLALPALIASRFSSDEEVPADAQLPRPLESFLNRMIFPLRAQNSISSWLMNSIGDGSIEATDGTEVPSYFYVPNNSDAKLPLHVTSSMVTELVPFIVALRTGNAKRHLIFEEPEAHLHLSAQREMARAIIRLVRSGTPVTVTTHSDTFVQQLNNLIRLADHPKRDDLLKQLGYEDSDTLDRSSVAAYEFCQTETGTLVKELKHHTHGFVVHSLNDTLYSLAEETMLLNEEGE
jgi:hypothetical protein